MKIQLPNGKKLVLDESISIEKKLKKVEELTEEFMVTINEYFKSNYNSKSKSNTVGFFLDGLSNYLVWHKEDEDKNKQDKEILSIKKVEQMEGKRKAPSIPFSSLSVTNRELLGLDGES